MKLTTWNVNSLKVRLPQVLEWLAANQPDALCIQETKMEDKVFPVAALEDAGYHVTFTGQKTYNGVAVLTRAPAQDALLSIPGLEDEQKRFAAVTVPGPDGAPLRLVCGYFPNGQAVGSDKYEYKLRWISALTGWLQDELTRHPRLALLGDYNIAPDDRDVYDPVAWKDQILCSVPERDAFRGLVALGLTDSFRLFDQPEKTYTWWDYRAAGFRRNLGLRIDIILLSAQLATTCKACTVDRDARKAERPSDHAPVTAELVLR